MTSTTTTEMVVVYETADPMAAAVVRNALTNEGMPCAVTGDQQGGFAGILAEVTVTVPADRADEARSIIEQTDLPQSN